MQKTKIRALILDYGEVISNPQNSENVTNMLGIIGQECKDFNKVYRKSRDEYDSGRISGTEYWTGILKHYGIEPKPTDIASLIQEDVKSWTQLNDSMLQFIKEIRNDIYRLAIISNMTRDTLIRMRAGFKWLGLFDELIFSCEFGRNKPDRNIYEACLNRLQLSPIECLFVDDSAENIEGAGLLGMNTIYFRSFDAFLSEFNEKFSTRK